MKQTLEPGTSWAPRHGSDGQPRQETGVSAFTQVMSDLERLLFGPPAPLDVTRRSRLAIDQMNRSSEILVGGLQVIAILVFGFVYAITPKAFSATVPFEPVPIVLGVYAAITAGRLALALTGRLTRPLVLLSAVIDVVVLMVTIWSFHLQYGVSPSVYLKAPTLLYVFILIALRALRLEAAPVLVAGAAAIVGWGALLAYALLIAGPLGVTRDWASYMTSDQILVGAEVDKLLAIAVVTGVLAVAVVRARRLMLREASERAAIEDLSRFFAPGVASSIREAQRDFAHPIAWREATVLIVDLQGFSALAASLSAESTLAILGEYHERIVPLIHHNGGAIDKYLGDGILATFGAVRPSAEHAAAGMSALCAIIREGERWRRERTLAGLPAPKVCAAMDAGPITMGVVGVDGRYEFTILGDVVKRVAKLDKLGRQYGAAAIVTEAAYAAHPLPAKEGISARRIEVRLPGLDEPAALVALMPPSDHDGSAGSVTK
ncbi:adenylate/guanylate cyclase domain-containing protein (plasmid) [Thalassobaculum sp. OXR-137]|uniref:adenylate/guanylate cyclase domain-containing protein n=1 Tax=Thalassobaculum sp. OXR-137 TaxID=3100173 RepID=UPI002AC9ED30|nr:adenylate/guanylate cyclase domain-containing protein [Thalassobaculum sp. OXR-137]WPZ37206.1 adenylate/guanylate cyclase domain-containing protein [Thalassobaculum sp. OXR-137]